MPYKITSLPQQLTQNQPQQQPEEESYLESGIKTLGRLPFRAAETALGYPQDMANFVSGAVNAGLNYGGNAIVGRPLGVPTEEFEKQKNEGLRLPTSSEIKEKTHELLPWTKSDPSSWSHKLERATEVLTALALPATVGKVLKGAGAAAEGASVLNALPGGAEKASRAVRAAQSIGNAGKIFAQEAGKDLAKVVGSETAGWMAQQLGASEETQTHVRMGTLLLSQLFGGRQKVQKAASNAYNEAEILAEGAERVNATGFAQDVDKMLNKVVNRGTSTEAKSWLQPHLETLKAKVSGGSMAVNDAVEFVQNLRGHLRDGNVPYRAQPQVHQMIDLLKKNVIDPYGKVNKKFGEVFGVAEQAWSALYKGNMFSNFIQQHFSGKPWASKVAGALTHAGITGIAAKAGQAIPALGITLTAHQSYRFLKLIKDSSIARDVYGKLIKASLAGNVSAASKMMQQFDKVAKNYEDKHPEDNEEKTNGRYKIVKI